MIVVRRTIACPEFHSANSESPKRAAPGLNRTLTLIQAQGGATTLDARARVANSGQDTTLQDGSILTFTARIASAEAIAHDIRLLALESADGSGLPLYEPGAHIDVLLPDGSARQYSLIDPFLPNAAYRIAVARDEQGRGGSKFLHDRVGVGDVLQISTPRCHFPVVIDSPHSMLFAGGIGITPVWCMAQALHAAGKDWSLHFGARSAGHASLLEDIRRMADQRLYTYFNLEGDEPMDIAALVATAPQGTHFYCCGPAPMIAAFREACQNVAAPQVHFEQFTAAAPAALDGGFDIELAKSGRTVRVNEGESILDALGRAGLRMSYSCREGVCGACETAVLSGAPDHRDAILTEEERAAGNTMMICCSGAISEKLVLDL